MLNRVFITVSALLTIVSLISCSKKQPTPAVAQTEAEQTNAAPAETSQPNPTPSAPTGPVLDTSQFAGDPKQAMAEADAALRQRNYQKAVQTMLAIQQAQLNAQQAEAARQQMIALQRNLIGAVDAGDPNAIAAAKLLRGSHSH